MDNPDTQDGVLFLIASEISPFVRNMWSCDDDCHYHCMWDTVNSFRERSWDVPQFHGKWPFIRIFGLQEPASVLFSIFNLVAHFIMFRQFRQEVRKTSPMYYLWHAYAVVCLNGWFWSAVFHARDVPFTEKMDYFCAFSMVLFSFFSMILRLLQGRYTFVAIFLSVFCIIFFIHHVTYLSLVHFDYSYNMLANVAVGAVTTLGWLMWASLVRKQQPYVWRCAAFSVLTGLCVCFEVIDFPPILWIVDAHSLFHLSTAGLPILFYRFLIDDCKYLHKQVELARDETFTRKKQ
ncbi:Post-GPI attachment to proteins factor 3 [Gryllus bimaculatus]|nr:Post-GPI attachment to proteins factor 3 [Gryllus bimaculatus]